jgi:MFS family permease
VAVPNRGSHSSDFHRVGQTEPGLVATPRRRQGIAVRAVGLSVAEVGLGLTVTALVNLVASAPMGYLADRYGPRGIQLVALVASAGCSVALVAVRSLPAFLAVGVGTALADAAYKGARGAVIAGAVPADQRVRTRAYLRAVTNVGISVGASGTEDLSGAARASRRAGAAVALACVLFAASGAVSTAAAVGLLLAGALVHVIGELWQSAAGWGISFGLAPAHAWSAGRPGPACPRPATQSGSARAFSRPVGWSTRGRCRGGCDRCGA